MGNHAAGTEIGLKAEVALANRKPGESAIDILDRICTRYRGFDAEFEAGDPDNPTRVHPVSEDYREPYHALGKLMVEAFSPNGLADLGRHAAAFEAGDDDGYDVWCAEVEDKFRQRYNFC